MNKYFNNRTYLEFVAISNGLAVDGDEFAPMAQTRKIPLKHFPSSHGGKLRIVLGRQEVIALHDGVIETFERFDGKGG